MNLNALEAFLAVVENGTYAAAAERLFTTVSTLQYQVRQLEQEAGAPLFEKVGRGVTPTSAGKRLAVALPPLLRGLSAAMEDARLLASVERTNLKVGTMRFAPRADFAAILSDVSAGGDTFEVREFRQETYYQDFLAGDVDVVFLFSPEAPALPETSYLPLWPARVGVVVRADDPAAKGDGVSLSELRGRTVLLPGISAKPVNATVEGRARHALSDCDLVYAHNHEDAQEHVRACGEALLVCCVEPPHDASLKFVSLSDFERITAGFAYRKDQTEPVIRRFLDYARNHAGL